MVSIQEKLHTIQQELKAPKNQYNAFGKYNYRSLEDILTAVKPLTKKTGTTIRLSDKVIEVAGKVYIEATAILSDTKSWDSIPVSAVAQDSGEQKGMQAAQVSGSTSSYARKYALNGLFAIDDTKDADDTNTHGKTQNLPRMGADEFKKAKDYITGGGNIESIKAKYSLTSEQEKQLL